MKYETNVKLKDGRLCVIRSATEKDAKDVYENFKLTHKQTDYLLTYEDENSFTIDQERDFLINKEKSVNEIELCAIVDNHIVGTAGVDSIGMKEKIKHRAEFGISIDKDYWKLGIGRALAQSCIECAKKAGYLQLELSVVGENVHAINLYKNIGFVEYGRNPKGFYSRITGWQEIVLMRLEL